MTKRRNQYNRPQTAGDLPWHKARHRKCAACGKSHIHRTDEVIRYNGGIANILCAERMIEAIQIETRLIELMRREGYVLQTSRKDLTQGKIPIDTRYKLIQLALNRKLISLSEKLTLIDHYGLALLHRKILA